MKKRALSVLLAIALLVGMLPVGILSARAYSETDIPYAVEGGYIYFDKETGTITDCDDSVTAANIPAEIDGVAVTSIGYGAFYYCSSLSSVTIPDSVTSIGGSAFRDCDSLTSITIPDSVTSIDEYAFAYCDSLTGIWVGEANEYYSCDENGVLFNKNKTTLIRCPGGYSGSYAIPDSVTSIEWSAFEGCDSLESVTIPDSVTSIGWFAFAYCGSLESVTIPDSVTSIGGSAFEYCGSLTSVTIGNGVTSIGWSAFEGCDSLKSVTIPDSVTSIGDYAFAYCDSLESVTIPDSVTSIGSSAFRDCGRLTSVTIPDSVTSIGYGAFYYCSSLSSVTIPDSVTSIGNSAFLLCGSLTGIWVEEANENYSSDENGVLFNKDKTDLIQCPGSYKGSYTIPDSVTSICYSAFHNCNSLESVTIPDSVTSMEVSAFYSCDSLTGIWVEEANEYYSSDENGVLFNKDKTTLIQCPGGYKRSYAIPDSVKYIDVYAFAQCHSLTSATIPNSVTRIGDFAFRDCNSLTGIFFMGDAPALGFLVFDYYDMETDTYQPIPGLTLYYTQGAEGWTTPTWNGYPTALWNPDGFVDVSADAWYADAVEYAVENGLFNGMSATTFEPETAMTRAMLVTVLWRYAGEPMEGENTFTDVPAGQWYTDAVAWAAHNNIVGGVGDNKFDPNGNVTREQMATILYRYTSAQGIDTSARADLSGFPDAGSVSSYAKDPICWAVAEGLINGSDGKLLPQGNATRAQVATILMRFIENVVK